MLSEDLEQDIEVKVLSNGSIVIFDYDYEITSSSISEGILRTLYYLLALFSSVNYSRINGIDERMIVGLEEPETHVFPFMMELLVRYVEYAAKYQTVIVSTHNPLFAGMLGDRIKDIVYYYVYRDRDTGSTRAVKIDLKAIVKDSYAISDILYMPPSEVVEKYSIGEEEEE